MSDIHQRPKTVKEEQDEQRRKSDFYNEIISIYLESDDDLYQWNDTDTQADEKPKGATAQNWRHQTRDYISNKKPDENKADDSSNSPEEESTSKRKSWNITRLRLTPPFIQQLIERTIKNHAGVTMAYLKESSIGGEIIVGDNMRRLCKSSPTTYEIVLTFPNATKDHLTEDYEYVGPSKFLIRNMPLMSQNNLYTVQTTHVERWIRDGLLNEDDDLNTLLKSLAETRTKLTSLDAELKRVATQAIVDRNGEEIRGPRADEERERRYLMLQGEKNELREKRDELVQQLEVYRHLKADKIEISLNKDDDDDGGGRGGGYCTWTATFVGAEKENVYAEKAMLRKSNWKTSLMFAHTDPEVVESSEGYLVDTSSVIVERVEFGSGFLIRRGILKEEGDGDTPLEYNFHRHVGCYHGHFVSGQRHGYGTLFTPSYIYSGTFTKNLPQDEKGATRPTLLFRNGDIVQGEFKANKARYKGGTDRYRRGLPHGQGTIQFADGGFFEGILNNGEAQSGIYISANGELHEGDFMDGNLVKGLIRRSNGDTLEGSFQNGNLHGQGTFESKEKRSIYRGNFTNGEKHDLGEETFFGKSKQVLVKYSGFFLNGQRHGVGTMDILDTGFSSSMTNTKEDLRVEGPWLAGRPKAGGSIRNVKTGASLPTTNRLSSRYKLLHRFKTLEDHKDSLMMKQFVQLTLNNHNFRLIVERKKKNIFESHFKTMIKGNLDTKRISASKTQYYEQKNLSLPPRSLEEAREKPGLGHRPMNRDSFKVQLSKSIGENGQVKTEHSTRTWNAYEAMHDCMHTINCDQIRKDVHNNIMRKLNGTKVGNKSE